jgi:Type II secretion system (T2SS), protein K
LIMPPAQQDRAIRPAMTGAPATRGAVILLVLVTVMLTAFLLSRFIQRAGTELLADAQAGDQARLRGEAYSALEVTLAVLADFRAIDGALHGPGQGWDDPLRYADYEPAGGRRVEIDFEDESGKVSLPALDQDALQLVLEQAGLGRREAELASDALLVWMRPDYTPASLENEAQRYERAALPHLPPQRSLASWQELGAIEHAREYFYDASGRPNDRWRWLEANVSLFAFTGTNLNTATPAALAAGGLSDAQAASLRQYLNAPPAGGGAHYFRSAAEANTVVGLAGTPGKLGAEVQVLRIRVTVHDGAAVFRMSAVVVPPGGSAGSPSVAKAPPPATTTESKNAPVQVKKLNYPFRILDLHEDIAAAEPPAEPAS